MVMAVINIFFILIEAFYFMMPSYFANMAPVIFKKINFLNYPIDFGKKIFNKPLFGKNKTWRGLFFGVLTGILTAFAQRILINYDIFKNISIISYENWIIFGFLMGFGALLGDSIKSFFKRMLSIPPGKSWIILDQIDYVLGSLALASLIYSIPARIIIISLIISPIITIIVNYISFYLKIRDEW